MRRISGLVIACTLLLAACSSPSTPIEGIAELPEATPSDIDALLAASERPVLLNIWASWCGPCRSEAPLLAQAHAEFGDQIRFIGIDVRDARSGARAFLAEFGLTDFEHYFDRTGAIPANLGGIGVPQTWFFAPGGTLVYAHSGVIDERTLALQIDELLRSS